MNITRNELILKCKTLGIKGYTNKKKEELLQLLEQTKSPSQNNKLHMVDLFAGTGAFSLAFEQTHNVDTVFANDMIEHSKTIYDANFKHELTLKNLHDVKNDEIPPHHILTAGFPCQPFSIAGNQKGFDDERSNVFWKILSIIDHHQPICVILENVKNLVSHDENKTFQTIIQNLEQQNYHVCYNILNTSNITGIPQNRERIYIVCLKSKNVFDKFNLNFPEIERRNISDFLNKIFLQNIITMIRQARGIYFQQM